MAIASSTSSRRQCSSHGAGQTRPRTEGNGMVRLKIRGDSRAVDVAGALVRGGRQAVGVVVGEDQLQIRSPEAADLVRLGPDDHAVFARPGAADGRVLLAPP